MERRTYIIAGGGCSGLSVALQLAQRAPASHEIILIDRVRKTENDRTWCFWAKESPLPSSLIHHSWDNLSFGDNSGTFSQNISPYTYFMVRSADWYAYMWNELDKYPQVRFIAADIHHIHEDATGPYVQTSEGLLRADVVLNSVQPPASLPSAWPAYHLWQHFAGWWIETDQDMFDPQDARLMDFRVAQAGQSRFMYVLPFSSRSALVEFTVFSRQVLSADAYEQVISAYLQQHYPGITYRIREKEAGKIPMTNRKTDRYAYQNVIYIGTVGGAVKPTTGYAFLRIQAEAGQIAQQLVNGEQVIRNRATSRRFAFYDRLLLHILTHDGKRGAGIFSALFRANPMQRILTFLNEQSTLRQEVSIFARLPYAPFLQALWKQLAFRLNHFLPEGRKKWPATRAALKPDHPIIQQEI